MGFRYAYPPREFENSKKLALRLTLGRSNSKTYIYIYISVKDLADEPLLCLNIHTDSIAVVGRRTVLLDFFEPFSLSASEALDHLSRLQIYILTERVPICVSVRFQVQSQFVLEVQLQLQFALEVHFHFRLSLSGYDTPS